MDKTLLTSNEFLSLYNGVLLEEKFDDIYTIIDKVFGQYPYVPDPASCSQQFKEYIDDNYPELAQLVKILGPFKKDDNRDVMEQIEEYCQCFEEMFGAQHVEVDRIRYKLNGKNDTGRNI